MLRVAVVLVVLLWAAPLHAGERIVLWHAYRGAELEALERVLSRWEGSPVEPLSIPHDAYNAKLSAAIPLGEGPDLFIDAHNRLGAFRERDLIAPVGDAFEEHYTAKAKSAVTIDGDRYAVPLSLKCVAMFYNPALVAKPPATMAEIEALAPPSGALPSGVYPLVYEAQSAYGHAPLLHGFGGQILRPNDEFGFVGPEAAASVDYAKHLLDAGVVPDGADGALVKELFRSGRAAVAFNGPWLASDLASSNTDYRVAVLPTVNGRPLEPFLTVEVLMLAPRGAARPEVRELARLLASADAAQDRMRLARTVSARSDIEPPADDEFLKVFRAQADRAVVMPTSTAMRAVWEPAKKAIRKVLRGDLPAEEALREAQWRFDDVLRPPPAPASPAPLMVLLGALALFAAYVLVKRARAATFRRRLRESFSAYRYLVHAVVAVGLLVFVPLLAGAGISLFTGQPGDLEYVGSANFVEILTARGRPLLSSGSFYVVLLVTVLWTALNLFFHLTIGMALGIALSRPLLRLRAVYRVLLIVPWAVPSYVTALAWKGMFHRQFGAVTALIDRANALLGTSTEPIDWFARFSTSFAANLSTNVWLGFPFMMVVTIAALTSVPKDVLEAAEVDGASRWQRFYKVTLPIIRPSLLPAALLGAIWTFNMFNVVFLVSGGEPDGTTDILVSEAYRWAFTRGANYGYAAAYAVLIFMLLMVTTKMPQWLARRERVA